MVDDYPAITDLERVENLIKTHRDLMNWYRSGGTQEDHRNEVIAIQRTAKKLHKLINRNRSNVHIPRPEELEEIRHGQEMKNLAAADGIKIENSWPGTDVMLYSNRDIKKQLLPTLEAITHIKEIPVSSRAKAKSGFVSNDVRRPFVRGLLECWDDTKSRPDDLINFLYDCFIMAGDKLNRETIEKKVITHAIRDR